MNRVKNQIAETKPVNRIKKAGKKDVKMQVSPTMSFRINTAPRIGSARSRLATMLMKTNGVIGEIGAPAQPQAWRWQAVQRGLASSYIYLPRQKAEARMAVPPVAQPLLAVSTAEIENRTAEV